MKGRVLSWYNCSSYSPGGDAGSGTERVQKALSTGQRARAGRE